MGRKKAKRIDKVHLLPGADEAEVRSRAGVSRRRRARYRLQLFVRLLIVLAVLLVILLVWQNWEKIAPESVLDWADAQFGEGTVGDGYPYAIAGNTVVGMESAGNYLVVLSEGSLKFMNTTAGCVEERRNVLTDPLLKTAGRYVLSAEIGGSRFRLETRREVLLETELTNRVIYAVDLLPNGMVAVVTDAATQSHVCILRVYDRRGQVLYEYNSSKYLITNVALSPNGRSLAAVGATAEAGALCSVLLLCDFSAEAPVEHVGTELLLFDVAHFGDTVLAVGDEEYWTVHPAENSVEKHSYNGMELIGFATSHSSAGMVVKQSGSTGTGVVWLFDETGTQVKKQPFVGTFRHASCRDEEFILLTDSTAFVWTAESEYQMNTPADSLMVAGYQDSLMVLTLSQLQQIKK